MTRNSLCGHRIVRVHPAKEEQRDADELNFADSDVDF